MPNPSNEAKQRWNASHYTQVKISINPEIAAAFKAACAADGVSMAGVLSRLMADYIEARSDGQKPIHPVAPKTAESKIRFGTRKERRSAVCTIAAQMGEVLAAEERYYDNVPENLQGSKWHEASETSIATMQEIIELMAEIYC